MTYKIAIASGKGGTGKTTVSVGLFHFLYEKSCKNIQLVDCDVEEPNDAIFFNKPGRTASWEINQPVPEIDNNKCTYCRKCVELCEFNAIVVIPPVNFAEVNSSLCHSCGACSKACRFSAIAEKPKPIGIVNQYNVNIGKGLLEGRLKIGSAMQTMLIRKLKKKVDANADLLLFDAPPGTSCPVVETVADADYVILVTEPTPFGLHDLKLTVELLSDIKKPFGIIINKAGLGNDEVYDYIRQKGAELLGEIPFSEEFASDYAAGNITGSTPGNIKAALEEIGLKLGKKLANYEGDNYFKW